MSRNSKILLGIVSFLPLVTLIAYLISFFTFFMRFMPAMAEQQKPPAEFFRYMLIIIISAIVMALISIGLLVYFLIHSINNPAVNKDERIMWILLFIFVGMISMPIYWYMRVWDVPEQPPVPGSV